MFRRFVPDLGVSIAPKAVNSEAGTMLRKLHHLNTNLGKPLVTSNIWEWQSVLRECHLPDPGDQGESRTDDAFEDAKQNSEDEERGKARCCTVAHEDNRPAENCSGEVFANGELDKADRTWEASYKVAEVEGTAAPGVLLAMEVRVCLDSHHRCIAQGNLVKVLEHVGHEHQGHQAITYVSIWFRSPCRGLTEHQSFEE